MKLQEQNFSHSPSQPPMGDNLGSLFCQLCIGFADTIKSRQPRELVSSAGTSKSRSATETLFSRSTIYWSSREYSFINCPLHRHPFQQPSQRHLRPLPPIQDRLHHVRRQQRQPQHPREIRRRHPLPLCQLRDGGKLPLLQHPFPSKRPQKPRSPMAAYRRGQLPGPAFQPA